MASTRKSKTRVVVLTVAIVAVVALAIGWVVTTVLPGIGQNNPLEGKSLYLYPDAAAISAINASPADEAEELAAIANTPSAVWLLPEAHSASDIGDFVDGIALDAEATASIPVFVVYGIPNRDCNNESAGGLGEDEYAEWVSAIGAGLLNHESVIILEPDSLSLARECGNVDDRIRQVSTAANLIATANPLLSAPSPTIYLDGGHSNWLSADIMADILNRAGIAEVQGFASNTANYNLTEDEIAYAEELSSLTGNSHYVIDTARNGNGTTGQWCNPSGRALGEAPSVIDDGTRHDANLWIKTPGESDGQCNGGPTAGSWWQAGALALVRNG
jgi:endoglucanase